MKVEGEVGGERTWALIWMRVGEVGVEVMIGIVEMMRMTRLLMHLLLPCREEEAKTT